MYSDFISFLEKVKPIEKEKSIYSSPSKATHISNFVSLDFLSPGSRRVREMERGNRW